MATALDCAALTLIECGHTCGQLPVQDVSALILASEQALLLRRDFKQLFYKVFQTSPILILRIITEQ